MNDCIFCKIANGEIPSATLFEDDEFRVILDVAPASKGHALILPKMHYADLTEMPDDLAGRSMVLAKKIVSGLQPALPCDGYNVLQNNGPAAGQTVFHYHVHLIPRTADDHAIEPWAAGELSDADRDALLEKARSIF